jgi:very-short-patch-repair endonuclease
MYYGASMEIFRRAEILRNHTTEAERMLWGRLNSKQVKGFKFRRQHTVNQFIVDFYCHKAKLVIELDGEIHNEKEIAERDKGRGYMLKNYGMEILRFNNDAIRNNIENVISKIKEKLIELTAPKS